ncbi:AAA family ATPase [Bacteroides timonensis]|uniref:AAA family ATPase n=1 Tax=Bacteroides timonensis TaxID=1470345 RepID=UPI0004B8E1F3|nr:AAA family ATPase [Bacteroides timonensis]
MIRKIEIQNYKGIQNSILDIRPLTILTGLNSTGKSSCLQGILTALYNTAPNAGIILENYDFSFETLRNKNVNAKDLFVHITCDKGKIIYEQNANGIQSHANDANVDLEKNLYYLCANRLGFSEMETISPKYKVGVSGEYVFGTFEMEKATPIEKDLVKSTESETLSFHFNWWLSYILNIKFEMQTERVTPNKVNVLYKSNDIPMLSPQQLGVGVSYLAKILIMCLRARKDDILMIENPEIHLHPAAQARLGEFFAYLVKAGIQLLIETHCEHLINRIQYEIYKQKINNENVILYYKKSIADPFETILFTETGKYSMDFPSGFFDATLDELLEME